MDILSRREYQCCVCQVGVTSIIVSRLLRRTTFITRPIRLKGGNAKANVLFQSCCIISVSKLFGYGFHAIYWESWWHSLKANRSTVGVPKSLEFSGKTLLMEFPIGRVCCISERSVCSGIQLASKVLSSNCDLMRQLWIAGAAIFKRYVRAILLPTWTRIVKSDQFFVNVSISNFDANNFRTFMRKCFSFFYHILPVETPLQYSSWHLSRHLSEWSYGVPVADFLLHCKFSSFPSTKGVHSLLNVTWELCNPFLSS